VITSATPSGRTPRIAPLPAADWGDDEQRAIAGAFGQAAVDSFRSGERPCPNVVTTLARHPTLTGSWLKFNNVLFRDLALEPRLRELAILRVAARTGAEYEWAQHVRMAQQLGVTDAEVDAAGDANGTGASHDWTPLEAAALDATDELIADHVVGDATYARLAEHMDDRMVMELTFVVGAYTCLAMAFNTCGIQLDDDLIGTGRPFPTR
jgi:alkylhydroperoxidase family enzyme